MGDKRAGLNFNEEIGLEELIVETPRPKRVDKAELVQAAQQSGFISREPQSRQRRRRKKSPFTDQQAIRIRPGMKDLFQDLGEYLDVMDHTTFERAMLALIEKEGTDDHLRRYNELTK